MTQLIFTFMSFFYIIYHMNKGKKKVNLFKYLNKPILILTLILAIGGAFLILDASSISSVLTYGNDSPYFFFKRQLIFIALSLLASIIIIKIPTKYYKTISLFLSLAFMGATLLIYAKNKLFSTGVNEVSINILGFNLQPAEFLKVFLVMYMGSYYNSWINKENRLKWGFLWPLFLCGISTLLILAGGDFGSAALMLALFALVFISIPNKDKPVKVLKCIATCGLVFCVLTLKFLYLVIDDEILEKDYRLNRFIYTNPCDRYEENSGYQVCNGYIAINNGGFKGSGIGSSVQKYLYLPASHTDFIFPIVVEELGYLCGTAIIIAYMLMIYFIFRTAINATQLQNSIVCYGIGIIFMLHVFINLGGVLGIIPLTGVPLPFLSYGGSFCVALICSLAVVQRINIESRIDKEVK